MWQPSMVERGLFRWNKWRNSIIKNWAEWKHDQDVPTSLLELAVGQELKEIGLPTSFILEIYWISCLTSDYNLDYPTTYTKIVTPAGLHQGGYKINHGMKAYPPLVISNKDIKFESHQLGLPKTTLIDMYSESSSYKLLLEPGHEFLDILNKMRGRPTLKGKYGPIPYYPDRLAIQCAALKDIGMSYVEIASKLRLLVTRPFSSRQSDVTVNLVRRGRKLLRGFSF